MRPRGFDEDEVLERILETFWTHGWRRTSVDELARATGLRKGSLDNAFGTKEAMFLRALERYAERFDARLDGALDDPDPAAALRGFLDAVVARMSDPANPRGCLSTHACFEHADLPPAAAARVEASMRRQLKKLEAVASRAIETGLLPRNADPRGQAELWYGVTRGMAAVHKVTGDVGAIVRMRDATLRSAGL